MKPNEIGRKATRIFQYQLPSNWVFRSQEDQDDFGIDGEIEIINPDETATGIIFKVQVKGKESLTFIENGDTITFQILAKRLNYYVKNLEIPLILFLIDVINEKIYWRCLQNDESLRNSIQGAINSKQQFISVRINAQNTFLGNEENLLNVVKDVSEWLKTQSLVELSNVISQITSKPSDELLEKWIKGSKKISSALFNEKLDRLFKSQNFEDLYNESFKLLNSSSEEVELRFVSGLYLEKCIFINDQTRGREFSIKLEKLYTYLLQIVRFNSIPRKFRLFAILLKRSMRLNFLVEADVSYFESTVLNQNDSFVQYLLSRTRPEVYIAADKEVKKTVSLIQKILETSDPSLFTESIVRILPYIIRFIDRLKRENFTEKANITLKWIELCVYLCKEYSKYTKDEGRFATALGMDAALKKQFSSTFYDEIKELIIEASIIENEQIKDNTVKNLEKIQGIESSPYNPTPEEMINFFKRRAYALGIDIDNPNDRDGKAITLGLRDFNPERVLKNCEHLIVVPGTSVGLAAKLVGLVSAGSKNLICLKKQVAMGGWSLDMIYKPFDGAPFGFYSEFCNGCHHHSPYPSDWQWSLTWHNQKIADNLSTIQELCPIFPTPIKSESE